MKRHTTSERLNEIMSKRNIRQVDILEKCKPYCEQYKIRLGRNDLSQYVSGKNEPGQEKLTILAKALNVSEAWLMGYENQEDFTIWDDADKTTDVLIEVTENKKMQDLVEQSKDLSDKSIKRLMKYIALLKDEDKENDN